MLRRAKIFDAVPARLVVGVMMFFTCWVNYMYRVNISLNIIAMVPEKINITTVKSECEAIRTNESITYSHLETPMLIRKSEESMRFDWSVQEQAYVVSGYFWGYCVTSFVGGPLTELFGARNLVFGTVLLSALMTIMSPQAARLHYMVLVLDRVIIGLASGVHFPAFHALVARWAPPDEKGIFVSGLMGGAIGTVATWSLTGPLIENYGWETAFYIPGFIGVVWSFLWWYLVYDTPVAHPRITDREKDYIIKAVGDDIKHTNFKVIPPLKSMATSGPLLALILLHYGNSWGVYFAMTAAPQYISQALGYNLSSTGGLASLPYVARQLFSVVFGYIGDYINRKRLMSTAALRKSFCIFSHIIPGLLLASLGYTGCSPLLTVAIMSLSLGSNGAATHTSLVNQHDLAPNYASTLYGIMNGIANTAGFVTPLITAYFTKDGNGFAEWRPVFIVGSSVYIATAIYFIIFGSTEIQKWNNEKNVHKKEKPTTNPVEI